MSPGYTSSRFDETLADIIAERAETGAAADDASGQRIVFLVGRDFAHPKAGGGDVQAWSWARYLVAQGWEAEFVCQSHPALPAEEVIDGVHVLRLGRGWRLSFRAWRYYRRLPHRPTIVYEDPIGADRLPYFSPLYARAPVVAVWHQVSAPLLADLRGRLVAGFLGAVEVALAGLYRGCWFWAPSEETAAEVTRVLRVPASNVKVVHPTAPPGIFGGSSPSLTGEGLLAIGVVRPYKAFHHMISAMPAILEVVPGATLTVLGRRSDVAYESALRRLSEEIGVADSIKWALNASEADKAERIGKCRALVLPSRLEGYGITTIEANAQGKPVIASSGVPAAAVTDGVNGLRFDYGDIVGLARAATLVLTDDVTYARLVSGSVAFAETRTVEAMSGRFEGLLATAIADGHRSPWQALLRSERSRIAARVCGRDQAAELGA
jgi:glycosyltransferase involved in cell wall biosynthesis